MATAVRVYRNNVSYLSFRLRQNETKVFYTVLYTPIIMTSNLLSAIATAYLSGLKAEDKANVDHELEVRFWTKPATDGPSRRLNRLDYDRVIERLKSAGFESRMPSGEYFLKVTHLATKIRVEISGLSNIQKYCENNDLKQLLDHTADCVVFRKKTSKGLPPADNDDFRFRVALNVEETLSAASQEVVQMISGWNRSPKTFRFMNRVSLMHATHPFRVDMSIVRSGQHGSNEVRHTNTDDARVFTAPDTYEMEIEALSHQARQQYQLDAKRLIAGLHQMSKLVLSGLQQTNYPCSYTVQNQVLREYGELCGGTARFIGPSQVTLQLENVTDTIEPTVPNIGEPWAYCVTEKADGLRRLLYISAKGDLYFIDSALNVIYTGTATKAKHLFKTVMDGEYIAHDKTGRFINTFAAFDLYLLQGEDVRRYPLIRVPRTDMTIYASGTRLEHLQKSVEGLQLTHPHNANTMVDLTVYVKQYYPAFSKADVASPPSIYSACNTLMSKRYEHNVDGLIFTPTLFGVGGSKVGVATNIDAKSKRWAHNFKWKPHNTIDFQVNTVKDPSSHMDRIKTVVQAHSHQQFKTVHLKVGVSASRHKNPMTDTLNDEPPATVGVAAWDNDYRAARFVPTSPYDVYAGECDLLLQKDAMGIPQIFTEEYHQVVKDGDVVEFDYRDGKWVPMRIRYDKTAAKSVGNDFDTANSNWTATHYPVTEDMICGKASRPKATEDKEDVYYAEVSNRKDLSVGLRNFHKKVVKHTLIVKACEVSNATSLIDFSCGNGGDIYRWIQSPQIGFAFGIDYSRDNIENPKSGAYYRYRDMLRKNPRCPPMLFAQGDSSKNIRNGDSGLTPLSKQIVQAVFGQGSKHDLLPALTKHYGVGSSGFGVSSCQFAMHYMFGSPEDCYGFMRNVAECTRMHGLFIATCYDGDSVFRLLKHKTTIQLLDDAQTDRVLWEITRKYEVGEEERLPEDVSSVGYQVLVYQDTIGQLIPEYLVSKEFVLRSMSHFGLELLSAEETAQMGLPESTGMFKSLYDPNTKTPMTDNQKTVSFLNRYYVFKKVRQVNAMDVAKTLVEEAHIKHGTQNTQKDKDIQKYKDTQKDKDKQDTQKDKDNKDKREDQNNKDKDKQEDKDKQVTAAVKLNRKAVIAANPIPQPPTTTISSIRIRPVSPTRIPAPSTPRIQPANARTEGTEGTEGKAVKLPKKRNTRRKEVVQEK